MTEADWSKSSQRYRPPAGRTVAGLRSGPKVRTVRPAPTPPLSERRNHGTPRGKRPRLRGRLRPVPHAAGPDDARILSVYDHRPVCLDCKREEERRADFEDRSREMIAGCIGETGKPYGDPAGFCFHHFCPFRCGR